MSRVLGKTKLELVLTSGNPEHLKLLIFVGKKKKEKKHFSKDKI